MQGTIEHSVVVGAVIVNPLNFILLSESKPITILFEHVLFTIVDIKMVHLHRSDRASSVGYVRILAES